MKILVLNTLYAPHEIGGAEMSTRALNEGLAAKGHDIMCVSLAPDGVEQESVIKGVRCYYMKLANIYWPHKANFRPPLWKKILWHLLDAYNPFMAIKIGRLMDLEKPDIVHMHNLQGFSVSAWWEAKRRGIPIVQTPHDYYLSCPNSSMYRNGKNCVKPCIDCIIFGTPRRLLSALPTLVVGVSARLLNRLGKQGVFTNHPWKEIIYNCNKKTVEAQPRFDKAPNTPLIFGFLGRIEEGKGLETILKAMLRLPVHKASLLIGGKGKKDYIEKLRHYDAANITFLGFVDPEDFFKKIDVLIVPSLWEEPLGCVAHEALGYGIPVFVSNMGGLPEIIQTGITGELFKAGDVDELAHLMNSAIEGGLKANKLRTNCLARAKDFSLEKYIHAYENLLLRVLKMEIKFPPSS